MNLTTARLCSAVLPLLVVLATPKTAGADCFQKVGGVPGAYNQPPAWWAASNPLGDPSTRWIDDPRWRGATSLSATGDQARFRALVETAGADRYLVVMWHVIVGSNGPNDDRLFFGFANEAGDARQVIEVDPNLATDTTATPTEGSTEVAIKLYNWSGSSWDVPSLIAPVEEARVDLFCPGASCDEWAFRARIPLAPPGSGGNKVFLTPGENFHFFYQLREANAGGDAIHSYPHDLDTITSESECLIGNLCIQAPNHWSAMTDSGTCNGEVWIHRDHIYVGDTVGNHEISLTTPNDIHAHPLNNMGAALNNNSIRAKFRLANWGSTIGDSPSWLPVSCAGVDTEGYVTGGAGSVPSGSPFDITCTWSVPAADRCKYVPASQPCPSGGMGTGERHPDQCVLVELASTTGTTQPYVFSPQSAYRNLMFTGASRMAKEAEIDVRGLESGDPKRDVYVYIKTTHMPERVTQQTPSPWARASRTLLGKLRQLDIELPRDQPAIGEKTAYALQRAMARGQLTEAEVMTLMPTYQAFVWHDSGKKLDGRPVLTPQPSFGYVLWHDGALLGWKHALTSDQVQVSRIAKDFYKLTVPQGGKVSVTTTIVAKETEDEGAEVGCVCQCDNCAPLNHVHPLEHSHRCYCRAAGRGRLNGLGLLLAVGLGVVCVGRRRSRAVVIDDPHC